MSISRRSFLKYSAGIAAAVPLVSKFLTLGNAFAADADLPMAKETEEPAKSLKYCPNADKPSKNCATRKAKEKKDQYCYNCQLYQNPVGEKKASKGKCMIMPKNKVEGGAWCQSWVKNPAVNG